MTNVISDAVYEAIKQSINRVFDVSCSELAFEVLPMNFSGRQLIRVRLKERDLLFTHYPNHSRSKIEKDHGVLQALHNTGMTPLLYDVKVYPMLGTIMMSDYVAGQTITFADGLLHCHPILSHLKTLHSLPAINAPEAYSIFSQIEDFQKPVADLFDDWSSLASLIKAIETSIKREPLTWVHHDLHIGNIILSPTEEIHFIDWEYAGIGDPYADLAILSVNLAYDTDAAMAMFAHYHERAMPKRAVAEFLLLRMCALFRVGLYYLSLKEKDDARALLANSHIPSFDAIAKALANNPAGLGVDAKDELIKAAIGVFRRERGMIVKLLTDCQSEVCGKSASS